MSEINKPENVDLKCPFNPNQYNIGDDNITVPAGTSAWALSLVYLGKQAHRSGWNAPIEHMRLAHKSEVGSADDGAAYIEKSDKDGYWSRWVPTQEDLMACDWNLLESESKPVCPEDSMLVFELTLESKTISDGTGWGYVSDEMQSYSSDLSPLNQTPFGTLNEVIKNDTNINKNYVFYWYESKDDDPLLIWLASSYLDQDSYQKVGDLFKNKVLDVTVNGVTYNIGEFNSFRIMPESPDSAYAYLIWYDGSLGSQSQKDVRKFGEILKQSGETKRFCFKWRDK
ncbi:DUF2829 domain-containing protein [Xenorhabdus bovienii]|uniref:Thoeris anti-defense Tad2 family protein n=1 Tax=Xenorhabdus bovienii TaxID=40576 RepID=UPI001EE14262|nr:MW1434 family type I TA system toxin [Xenorhabdus bovienii]MCG3462807.1 DUF2829 domain-containing protein [Xenorhabdus bovienii]